MPELNSYQELLPACIDIARAAGDKIMDIYKTDFEITDKSDSSPLTTADLAANKVITDGLAALTPDIPLLSEEAADISWEERQKWSMYWLIDPLDGTKEFIKKNGEFTVNIALIDNHRPVLGVVHVPAKNQTYYAALDAGAYLRDEEGVNNFIEVRKAAGDKPTVVASRSHRGEAVDKYLANLGDHEITSMGSSLKLCLIAEGVADLYPRLGLTCEWDTAAAQAVVEVAGGKVTKTDGTPLLYNTKDEYLNPHFLVFGDKSRDWPSYIAE